MEGPTAMLTNCRIQKTAENAITVAKEGFAKAVLANPWL
jgi:hypothetical protein